MTKLQKQPLPATPVAATALPNASTSGVPHHEISLSPPNTQNSLSAYQATQLANALRISTQPLAMNNPYSREAQERRTNFAHFQSPATHIASAQVQPVDRPSSASSALPQPPTAGQSVANPLKNARLPPSAPTGRLASPEERNRASSAPPPSSRLPQQVAEDGHDGIRPPQYKLQASNISSPTSRGHHTRTGKCPNDCRKCRKRRPESLENLRNNGSRVFPAELAKAAQPSAQASHHNGSVACSPDCTKCGKKKPASPPNPAVDGPQPPLSAPRAVSEAHVQSVVEGEVAPPPLLSSIQDAQIASSSTPSPKPHHNCHKCGRSRRPASPPNSPPLPSPIQNINTPSKHGPDSNTMRRVRRSQPRPLVLGGFEDSSTTTLVRASYVNNTENSPLIAKKSPGFDVTRKASWRRSFSRRQPSTDLRPGSLIRRISNALRPGSAAERKSPPRNKSHDNSAQPSPKPLVAPIEVPPRPSSPFSFVGAASDDEFEMKDMVMGADERGAKSPSPAVKELKFEEVDHENTFSPIVTPPTPIDGLNGEEQDQAQDMDWKHGGENTVMRRAVSGSIRRFKSLKGAHRNWYQTNMTLTSEDYDGPVVGVY